jgi:exonuclease SbcC
MKVQDVTPEYRQALEAAGYKLSVNDLIQAKSELEALQHQHSAEDLKRTLEKGQPCPVCEQSVARVPKARKHASIDAARNSIKQREKRVSEFVKNKSMTEGELTQLRPQIDDRRQQIGDLDSLIGDACSRLSKVIDKAPGPDTGDELVHLRDNVQKLQDELEQCNKRLESLRQEETRLSNSAQEHHQKFERLTVEIAGLSTEISRIKTEMEKLRIELGEHADALAVQSKLDQQERARNEREALHHSREAAATSISRSKDEQTAAFGTLEQLRGQASALDKTRDEASRKTSQLEVSLASDFAELNIGASAADADAAAQLEIRASGIQTERTRVTRDIARYEHQIEDMISKIKRVKEVREEMEKHRQEGEVASTLARSLQSNQFIAFIQQEAFHRLAADGTRHLNALSSERYAFASEGDDFVIIDHWNADEPRPVTTLSGGETFLASVALALALAEGLAGLSHGHARFALDSLFLDEGFGTLDSETLDVVLQGVETLSMGDRLVGIVSHIPELAERMPSRIHVRKSVGGSTIDVS